MKQIIYTCQTRHSVEESWHKFCQNYKSFHDRNSTFNKKCVGKFIRLSDYKHDNPTLTVYQGKVNKNVLLLSSLQTNVNTANTEKIKADTAAFYYWTKFDVDVLDQTVRQYSTKSASGRQPLQIFSTILDMTVINAWILCKEITGNKIIRQNFILWWADKVRLDYIMPKGSTTVPDQDEPSPSSKRRQCQVVKCQKNRTKNTCILRKKGSLWCLYAQHLNKMLLCKLYSKRGSIFVKSFEIIKH
jgi:hypothetical protein